MPASDDPAIRRVIEAAARNGVELQVTIFDVSTHTALEAASALGVELAQIVKSLVFAIPTPDGAEPVICLVSGSNRVDVGQLSAAAGAPGIRRATASEARELTGYSIGGIPPFGHARPVRVFMDPDLQRFDVVWAAAGTPRAVFPMAPDELRALAGAEIAQVGTDAAPPSTTGAAPTPGPTPGPGQRAGAPS